MAKSKIFSSIANNLKAGCMDVCKNINVPKFRSFGSDDGMDKAEN